MHITRQHVTTSSGKTHETVLLRESYREGGKVKKRTLLNLTHKGKDTIGMFERALSPDGSLVSLGEVTTGPSVGAHYVVAEMAKRLGIVRALGTDRQGQLALLQVIDRVIGQHSRLGIIRTLPHTVACRVTGLTTPPTEDDLYANLAFLADHQEEIEDRLFADTGTVATLYLYDVTSSYLEGTDNELARYGYNRDKKKGKLQIVIGLLSDGDGLPVSVSVFEGNTLDPSTVSTQVATLAERFHCKKVTFVGDRGMCKSTNLSGITKEGWHYITAITTPQVERLLRENILQMSLFEDTLAEVSHEGVRYILRRNPVRANEIEENRASKEQALRTKREKANTYLAEHPRASVVRMQAQLTAYAVKLRINAWTRVAIAGRVCTIEVDTSVRTEEARLDGCYVITTDLPVESADAETVHTRYKDLKHVERAFRTLKTTHLAVRPLFVRKEKSTRGHVFVAMLAYRIVRELERAWKSIDLPVVEGIARLRELCAMEVTVGGVKVERVPKPCALTARLLSALDITVPTVIEGMDTMEKQGK